MLKIGLRRAIFILPIIALASLTDCRCTTTTSSRSDALIHPGENYLGTYIFEVNMQAGAVQVSSPTSGPNSAPGARISVASGMRIGPTIIQGVQTISASPASPPGNGTLKYSTASGGTLTWQAQGDVEGTPIIGVSKPGAYSLTSGTPSGSTISVRTVGNLPASDTSDGNVLVTLAGPSANGPDTISFDTQIAWNDPGYEIGDARLSVVSSTARNVALVNGSVCAGTVWSSCPETRPPSMTYVSDNSADGPISNRICGLAVNACTSNITTSIFQGCGSATRRWLLARPGGGGAFKFWANLYGNKRQVTDVTADPRYRDDTATVYLRTFHMADTPKFYPAEGAANSQMESGEWFYVHYYVDAPGNNRPIPYDGTDTGVKNIEDAGNLAAWNNGSDSVASYWFLDSINALSLRFDPAVIEMNARMTNPFDPPGNGRNKFMTQKGTMIKVITTSAFSAPPKWNIEDQYDKFSSGMASNRMGYFKLIIDSFTGSNPVPGNGARGLPGASWDIGAISLHAKTGLAGTGAGSFIRIMYDPTMTIYARNTNGNPRTPLGQQVPIPRTGFDSASWPNWCLTDLVPNYTACPDNDMGAYNAERTYICIQ